jgi:hypothetical protein
MIQPEVPIATEINQIEIQIVEGRPINTSQWRISDHARGISLGTISVSIVFLFWMIYLFGTPRG